MTTFKFKRWPLFVGVFQLVFCNWVYALNYEIPSQNLSSALKTFAEQSGVDVFFAPKALEGLRSSELIGEHAVEPALRILLTGNPVSFLISDNGAVVIVPLREQQNELNNETKESRENAENCGNVKQAALNEHLEVLTISLGSRHIGGRTVRDSPVPVDIIPINDIVAATGDIDLNRLLHRITPAFNANRQHGADGSDHIDPASLRGLGPDQLLVLVNGKRRHTSSLVNIFGSSGRGNVGTDMNAIPISAIKRIEVLRDGAAAQYGSDAIAGVINIVLKDKPGTQFSLHLGENVTDYTSPEGHFFRDDGEKVQFLASHTELLKKGGQVSVSLDYHQRQQTERTYGIGETPLRTIGSSGIDNISGFYNVEIPVSETAEIYSFGGISRREGLASAFTRAAQSERNVQSIYPNGFVPNIESEIVDDSIVVGWRGELDKWRVDLSNAWGRNRFHYSVSNSLNASLGNDSPRDFDAGGFSFSQQTINFDMSRDFESLSGLKLALGFEHRTEQYEIFAGEQASYVLGDEPPLNGRPRPAGSQGFPGFTPANELDEERYSSAIYIDVELEPWEDLLFGAAFRAEHYSDFGNTSNYKLVARYFATEDISLRVGYNTGFRAPSLPQLYFNNTFTDVEFDEALNQLITQEELLATNNSNIAQSLGVPQLNAENSDSLSLGFSWQASNNLTLTFDTYRINIADRVVLTRGISRADLEENELFESADFLQNNGISNVQFFVNAINTRTLGADLIVEYEFDIGAGKLSNFFGANYNNTAVVGNAHTPAAFQGLEGSFLARRERLFIESGAPGIKGVFSVNYEIGNYLIAAQTTYFGEIHHAASNGEDTNDQFYSPKTTMDLTASYQFNTGLRWSIGALNLFDQYPDEQNPELISGALWRAVQMGINGRFLFMRASLTF